MLDIKDWMSDEGGSDGIAGALFAGIGIALLLIVGIGGWAATAQVSGAVIAPGTVVVESNVKKVQHPTGGVVGEILVKEGDRVRAGDLLMRLDETITRANLLVITKQLDELMVRQARLEAERDGKIELALPQELQERAAEPEIQKIVAGERVLLESRHSARDGQKSQLRERIAQLKEEISGLEAQQSAKAKENYLIDKELEGLEQLSAKNLVPITKLMAMRREAARLQGERAQLVASVAQTKGKIAEIELQIIQIDEDLRAEVMKDLREDQGKQAELDEKRVAAEDQLKRIDIRAPQSGFIHELAVHTVGGVITPGEPVMLIVPGSDALIIEAKVSPEDIDRIQVGQPTFIRFPAFNQRTTPEFDGTVTVVSADVMKEAQTNRTYYIARVALADQRKTDGLKLVPGMPAEVHIRTSERTPLSYLLKPLKDQYALAFRER
jgi:HlyD family secretion protein